VGPLLLLALTLLFAPAAAPAAPAQAAQLAVTRAAPEAAVAPYEPRAAGLGTYFSGLNNRTRIVQFCVIVMCIALFILMKK
jgi:hypothetical protein